MTTVMDAERIRGSVHDLEHIATLDDSDCNVLFVSSRTLAIIQDWAGKDVAFITRYAQEYVDQSLYIPADPDGASGQLVADIINNMELETMPVTCDLVEALAGIESAIRALSSGGGCAGCEPGTELEQAPSDGTVSIGPGERFPDQATYDLAKCAASNAIYDQILDATGKLKIYNVDTLGDGGISIAVGIVTTLLLSGPAGWAIALVLGTASGLTALLLGQSSFSLQDIEQIWQDAHSELVCALYEATDTNDAIASIVSIIAGAGATTFEQDYVSALLTYTLINQLYDDMTQDIENYVSPDPVDCSGCAPGDCDAVPITVAGIEHGSGDYTLDSASRVLSSVYDPNLGYHYISIVINAYQGTNCAGLAAVCPGTQNIQLWVDSYSGYNFAGHSANGLCDGGVSITPEITGSGLPNPIGSWARTTIIEWVSTTAWTMTCRLRNTP